MSTKLDDAGRRIGGQRQRKRLRGMFTGKTGRAIGVSSIAAPIIGYIVNDLKKPDSIIRGLVGGVVRKFLPAKSGKIEAIDITDKVEILEDKGDKRS